MSKPNWLNVSPMSGTGDSTLTNSASQHTGRVSRQGKVTVTAVGVSTPATYNVTQQPKPEFVAFDEGASISSPKGGGTLTISGTSNSAKLTCSLVGESYDVEVPAVITVAGVETPNGQAIEGDPGATAQYNFSVELDIPLNDTIEEITRTLKIQGATTTVASQISIVQTAGDPRISVSTNAITLDMNGNAVSVEVSSNTTWSVS